jgi:ABC-2 type transport system permease protein
VVVVYGALWFSLAVLVNAYSRSSAASALALVVCWLALAVLIPSAVNIAATALHPVPSRAEFVNARRAADAELRGMTAELSERFFDDHPEYPRDAVYPELGRNYIGNAAEAEEMGRRMRPIRDLFDRQIAGQQAFIDLYRFLLPVILLQDTLRDLAGTGRGRYKDFLSQVEAYQQTWRRFFWAKTFLLPPMTSSNYDQIPRFTYRERHLREVTRRMAVPLATMFAMAIALGLLGLRAYRRYSVVG